MGDSFWTPGYQEEFEKKRRNYVSGYGMPSTEQSINALAGGNSPGTSSFIDTINSMNNAGLGGNNYFGPVDYGSHPEWYSKDQTDQGMFSKGVGALGGWGALANIGLKGYGLYQQGQQIDDLRDWRAKLNERANASLAMDREKMDMVREDYNNQKLLRKANVWGQRPQDENANKFTNQFLSQEA
jgi:hypothetical protein